MLIYIYIYFFLCNGINYFHAHFFSASSHVWIVQLSLEWLMTDARNPRGLGGAWPVLEGSAYSPLMQYISLLPHPVILVCIVMCNGSNR